MSSYVASPPNPFNTEASNLAEEWTYWSRSFNDFCDINQITDNDLMLKLFRSSVGRQIVEFIDNQPDSDALNTIQLVFTRVAERFQKGINRHSERLKFRSTSLGQGESLLEYLNRLNKYSRNCDFNNYSRDDAHLEMLLLVSPQKIKEKLLLTDDLNLDKAKRILQAFDAGCSWLSQANSLKFGGIKVKEEVNFNRSADKDQQNKSNKGEQSKKNCSRCGSVKHLGNDQKCPARKVTCNKCGILGHFAKWCKTSAAKIVAKKTAEAAEVPECNEVSEARFDGAQYIFTVDSVNNLSARHKYVEVCLNDKRINLLVDSGSNHTILPMSVFNKIKLNEKSLKPTSVRLIDCQGNDIPILGEHLVHAKIGKDQFYEKVLVTALDKCLLGNSFIRQMVNFNWNEFLTGKASNKSVKDQSMMSQLCETTEVVDSDSELIKLKATFKGVFADAPGKKVKGQQAHLVLKNGATPKFLPARTVPVAIEKQVNAEIDKMVKVGYWTPVTQSKWATPLVPVPKADGGIRICGDYKPTVNAQLEVAHHPLPTLELITSKLSGNKVFTKIDLKAAFNQLELDQESAEICTVNTSKGLFRVNRLPFGVASSPALWQRTIDNILKDLPGVCVFVDDILIAAPNEVEHFKRLKLVLEKLAENDVHVKESKCVFLTNEVAYLGFKITDKGILKTREKIEAISNARAPTNITEVRSFLGLVTFYGKFIPNLATIAAPLYTLMRKDVEFEWNAECKLAFNQLKDELCSDRFLTYYDRELPLKVVCDASPVGVGAVLAHVFPDGQEKPIAYASRTLTKSERNYSQLDKESLALIFAVKHFHFYLYGNKRFTLVTDHKPLISLFGEGSKLPTLVAARLQRWALILGAYNYKIEYRKGTENSNADALSRFPIVKPVETVCNLDVDCNIETTSVLNIESIPFTVSSNDVVVKTKADKILSVVHDCILKGIDLPQSIEFLPYQRVFDQLNIDKGCVLKANRVTIPSTLRREVLSMLHNEHMGISKTKSLARYYVWWPKIDEDIETLIKECEPCQVNRNEPEKHSSHTWEYPGGPWQRIHIDFCGPFRGQMYLVIVDAYSKWPEVIRMSSTTSQDTIKILFSLFARHGLPHKLVSDNGPQFTSNEFQLFLNSCGILHIKTAPYHPATNGEAERFVSTFKNFVKKFDNNSSLSLSQLDKAILNFLLTYRCTPHSITELTPSYLMFGRQIRSSLELLRPVQSKVELKNVSRQDKHCKTVPVYTEGESVLFRDYTSSPNKWSHGIVFQKKGDLHYLIKFKKHILKRHIDQLNKTNVKVNVQKDDLIAQVPTEDDNLDKILPPSVSTGTVNPVPLTVSKIKVQPRRSARTNKGMPPLRYGYFSSDSD